MSFETHLVGMDEYLKPESALVLSLSRPAVLIISISIDSSGNYELWKKHGDSHAPFLLFSPLLESDYKNILWICKYVYYYANC